MARRAKTTGTTQRATSAELDPLHDPRTAWFRHARFGMFIHWGIYAIPARGEWVRNKEKISDEDYQVFFEEFNPVRYDPSRWARLARLAGMKYAVITTKHHDGFCLFDSEHTDFKATNTPARRDLIRQYVEAFRAEGLKVGFYYSLLDWHHEHYPIDRLHPLRDLPDGQGPKAIKRDTSRYVDYLHKQVRELMTNYGKIDILWFDFSYDNMAGETWRATELVAMVRKLQPHIILNRRLTLGHADPDEQSAGLGDLATPEQMIPATGVVDAKGRPQLWEACMTMNSHWGYARDDRNFKSPRQLVHMLVECVSKGGNLLLNVGPTALGEVQEEAQDALLEIGAWMNVNGESIYGCSRAPLPKPDWGRYTLSADGKTLYAHILERPMGPIMLEGLGGKIAKARLLADGSEVSMARPWNVPEGSPHQPITLYWMDLDPIDQVVKLSLKEPLQP